MSRNGQPHDLFFKAIFSNAEAAATALRRVLPPSLAHHIDWSGMEPVATESVSADLVGSRADLVFRAPLAGRTVWFNLMLEHQSSVPRRMPLRFLRYMLSVWTEADGELAADDPLPLIVPVVLYHGARPWTGPIAFQDMFAVPEHLRDALDPLVPTFRLVLDDLYRAGPLDHGDGMALAIVGLSLLKHAPHDPDLRPVLDRLIPHLGQVARMPQGQIYFSQIARYVLLVGEQSAPEVRDALLRRVPRNMAEVVMTAGEQLIAQGRAEGLAKGRAEGRAEARAETLRAALIKMVRLKFGDVPDGFAARVEQTDPDTLERWSDRIFDAQRFEDLFD